MARKDERLESGFSFIGAFWQPESADLRMTGTLTFDGQHIDLTTAPEFKKVTFDNLKDAFTFGRDKHLAVLQGFTAGGLCTLFTMTDLGDPGLSDFRTNEAIAARKYRVSLCLMGMQIGGLREHCFDSGRYTLRGWHQWLPRYVSETWGKDSITIKIPTKPMELAATQFDNEPISIKMKLNSLLKTPEDTSGRLSQTDAFIEIDSTEKQNLLWYLDAGSRLENLFSLLTGTSLALDTVHVYQGKEAAYVKQQRNLVQGEYDFQSGVSCNAAQLGTAMKIWLAEGDRFKAVESLALGALRKQELFVETEFLSLAQALEGFHRATTFSTSPNKLALRKARKTIAEAIEQEPIEDALKKRICESVSYANEPILASRLADLCRRISSDSLFRMELDPAVFIPNVVFMRNFYTHVGGPQRRNRTPLGFNDLFFLTQKMRALLRGVMLLHLQLPENILVNALVRDATRWR